MVKSKFWIFYGPIRPGSKFDFFFESNLKLSQNFEPKKASIGKRIVTKELGAKNYQPMEIIDEYKYKEGTEENKKAWAHAQKFVGHGTKVF